MKMGKLGLWLWAMFIAGAAFHQFVTLVPANNFLISLIANMQWQIAAGFGTFGLVLLFWPRFWLSGTVILYALGIAVFANFDIDDYVVGLPRRSGPTVYFQNVGYYASQDDPDAMAAEISQYESDIYVLIEPSKDIVNALSAQLGHRPVLENIQFGLGCAVWVVRSNGEIDGQLMDNPNGASDCLVRSGDWEVRTVHPIPPVSPLLFDQHLESLDQAQEWLEEEIEKKRLLVGDFNMSYLNPHIRSRFKNIGTDGVTWGADRLKTMLFSMPLDFVATPNWRLWDLQVEAVGTHGSDHRGLMIDILVFD